MTIRSRDRKRAIHNAAIAAQCTMANAVFDQRNHTATPQRSTEQLRASAKAALNDDTRPDWMKPKTR